jgi:hypothetical protein
MLHKLVVLTTRSDSRGNPSNIPNNMSSNQRLPDASGKPACSAAAGSATLRALAILRDWPKTHDICDHIRPREFAELMWPDSPGWSRCHKCGPYGSSFGAMMPKVGGGFLGKLRARGLITYSSRLTRAGEDMLNDSYQPTPGNGAAKQKES